MTEDEARRIYRLMMITGWADGRLDPSEVRVADELASAHAPLQAITGTATLAREAREHLERAGLQVALSEEAAGIVDPDARKLAFLCCARVLEADRAIAHQEFQVLSRLKASFGLQDAEVADLLARAKS